MTGQQQKKSFGVATCCAKCVFKIHNSREFWFRSAKFRVASEDVSLEASLSIIPPVSPVVVVVFHIRMCSPLLTFQYLN